MVEVAAPRNSRPFVLALIPFLVLVVVLDGIGLEFRERDEDRSLHSLRTRTN